MRFSHSGSSDGEFITASSFCHSFSLSFMDGCRAFSRTLFEEKRANSERKTNEERKMSNSNRREFVRMIGFTALSGALSETIAKAQQIQANNLTGTINDVQHIVILMQENRPFDHHFGTLQGVRGFNDPRAININLPLSSGTGSTPVPVFLQPAGASNIKSGFAVAPNSNNLGGPANGVDVVPPFRVNPADVSPGQMMLGLTYFAGTNHSWKNTQTCWNLGQHDSWASENGYISMSYMIREDLPYHYALADAFTVGDAYHSSIMGPTNPNRMYLWTGCVGNVNYLGAGGTDGDGYGPVTANGLSPNNAYYVWETFPETLQAAGITWKIYQDLAGTTFSPDFGDGTSNSFAGNYTDNSVLYFKQYAMAAPGTPLYDNGCSGTQIINSIPASSAPASAWQTWAQGLFAEFASDVASGNLPQVSWIVAPAGYTEHPSYPIDYGAWYISQIFGILVSNPAVFSQTVFIINYDEADGSFDHIPHPTAPLSSAYGASTVSIENEIITNTTPTGPVGMNCRVPFLAISPWSKGGYVNSQVFDHTSVIQFIEKRFGVLSPNISLWRRAVAGDLTSCFNFVNPNAATVTLPSTSSFLPPTAELAGGGGTTFTPTLSTVILGVPAQETGIRPAKALPYQMDVQAVANASANSVSLTFLNTGSAAVVFHVRSGNTADVVRSYTVEAGKQLADTWEATPFYGLYVYGPNGFVRYFNGSIGNHSAALSVAAGYGSQYGSPGSVAAIGLTITNLGGSQAQVNVLDAYTGIETTQTLAPNGQFTGGLSLDQFYGWYDLIVTVAGDRSFQYRLAGHVETGQDSYTDPALGGLVQLQVNPLSVTQAQ
jgi:phospholipase C